jgi:hypothetical protein
MSQDNNKPTEELFQQIAAVLADQKVSGPGPTPADMKTLNADMRAARALRFLSFIQGAQTAGVEVPANLTLTTDVTNAIPNFSVNNQGAAVIGSDPAVPTTNPTINTTEPGAGQSDDEEMPALVGDHEEGSDEETPGLS